MAVTKPYDGWKSKAIAALRWMFGRDRRKIWPASWSRGGVFEEIDSDSLLSEETRERLKAFRERKARRQ